MTATKTRTIPLLAPKINCCARKWTAYMTSVSDHRNWVKQLARQLPRDGRPSPAQQRVLDERKGFVAQARENFFSHIDDTTLEHK